MRRVEVQWSFPSHGSARGAIGAAARIDRDCNGVRDAVSGKTVRGLSWADDAFTFDLGESAYLNVSASDAGAPSPVACSLDPTPAVDPAPGNGEDVLLVERGAEVPRLRRALAGRFTGARLRTVFLGDAGFWVHRVDGPSLCFRRLEEVGSGRPLLDWFEDDS